MIADHNKRRIGSEIEGHYPCETHWPIYEYRCPECGIWHQSGGDVTQIEDDGSETYLCRICADALIAEGAFA